MDELKQSCIDSNAYPTCRTLLNHDGYAYELDTIHQQLDKRESALLFPNKTRVYCWELLDDTQREGTQTIIRDAEHLREHLGFVGNALPSQPDPLVRFMSAL
jgi:hypothetical protein